MKPTLELQPHALMKFTRAIAQIAQTAPEGGFQRFFGLLENSLGISVDSGYRAPDYRPATLMMPGLTPRKVHDSSVGSLAEVKTILNCYFPHIRQEAEQLLHHDVFLSAVDLVPDSGKFAMSSTQWTEAFLRGGYSPSLTRRILELCPKTDEALELLKPHLNGDVSFSVLEPGTVIPEHFGEINFRLTAHLPLVVPGECGLSVGGCTIDVEEAEFFVFDDCYRHHAWNNSDKRRINLILMLWNPEVTQSERLAVDSLLQCFRRPSNDLPARLLRLLSEQRIQQDGQQPISSAELSHQQFSEQLDSLEEAIRNLRDDDLNARKTLLSVYQLAGLASGTAQENAPLASADFNGDLKYAATDRALLLDTLDGSTLIVDYGEQQVEVEGALCEVIAKAFSSSAFVPNAQKAVLDEELFDLYLNYLQHFLVEGLIRRVE